MSRRGVRASRGGAAPTRGSARAGPAERWRRWPPPCRPAAPQAPRRRPPGGIREAQRQRALQLANRALEGQDVRARPGRRLLTRGWWPWTSIGKRVQVECHLGQPAPAMRGAVLPASAVEECGPRATRFSAIIASAASSREQPRVGALRGEPVGSGGFGARPRRRGDRAQATPVRNREPQRRIVGSSRGRSASCRPGRRARARARRGAGAGARGARPRSGSGRGVSTAARIRLNPDLLTRGGAASCRTQPAHEVSSPCGVRSGPRPAPGRATESSERAGTTAGATVRLGELTSGGLESGGLRPDILTSPCFSCASGSSCPSRNGSGSLPGHCFLASRTEGGGRGVGWSTRGWVARGFDRRNPAGIRRRQHGDR
jgi:hypothetical protein